MVCFCCCRVKFNVKINKEYVGAPDFILRILITVRHLVLKICKVIKF